MARLPIIDPAHATGSIKNGFDALQKGLGIVPNLTRVMANSPAVLSAYLQFSGALSAAALPAKQREQIALLTAETNECAYCLSAHTVIGGKVGLTANEIQAARRGESSDPRTQAVLTFASRVLAERGALSDADVKALRAAGATDGEIAEIVATVALNVFTNYFNRALAVDIDFPVVRPLSGVGV